MSGFGLSPDDIGMPPDIAQSASISPLRVFALMLLILGVLIYLYFQSASVRVRIGLSLAMYLGVFLYGLSLLRETRPPSPETRPASALRALTIHGMVLNDQGGVIDTASVSSLDGAHPVLTDSSGMFDLIVRMPVGQTTVLRLYKAGYVAKHIAVTPPVANGLQIQLTTATSATTQSAPMSALEHQSSIVRFKYDCWSDRAHRYSKSTRQVMLEGKTRTVVFIAVIDSGKWACGVSLNPDRSYSGFIYLANNTGRGDGYRVTSGRSEVDLGQYHMFVESAP